MKYVVVAIKDAKSRVWNTPAFEQSADSAIRAFGCIVSDGKSLPSLFPADFDLWCIGSYDADTGVLTSCDHEHLANGADFARQEVAR